MYSATQRLGTFLSFFFSCLLVTLAVISVSNFVLYPRVQPASFDFAVRKLALYRGVEDPYMKRPTTLAELRFDLNADFAPLFHWNAKQIYLYLVLEYETADNKRNEMIVWDKIIQSPAVSGYADGAKLSTRNARNKYPIADIADQLNGKEATLSVRWNTVSHVGKLMDTTQGVHKVTFPVAIPKA